MKPIHHSTGASRNRKWVTNLRRHHWPVRDWRVPPLGSSTSTASSIRLTCSQYRLAKCWVSDTKSSQSETETASEGGRDGDDHQEDNGDEDPGDWERDWEEDNDRDDDESSIGSQYRPAVLDEAPAKDGRQNKITDYVVPRHRGAILPPFAYIRTGNLPILETEDHFANWVSQKGAKLFLPTEASSQEISRSRSPEGDRWSR